MVLGGKIALYIIAHIFCAMICIGTILYKDKILRSQALFLSLVCGPLALLALVYFIIDEDKIVIDFRKKKEEQDN